MIQIELIFELIMELFFRDVGYGVVVGGDVDVDVGDGPAVNPEEGFETNFVFDDVIRYLLMWKQLSFGFSR